MSEETIENRQGAEKKPTVLSRITGALIIIAAIAVAGYIFMYQDGRAVAVVNGEKITRAQYDERYVQLTAIVTAQGGTATSTEIQAAIKKQVLDDLVSESILLQKAKNEGITADAGAVDAQLSQNKAQFADDATYKKALTTQGFTESSFKNALAKSNIIEQYLMANVDLSSATSTPEEVKSLYDEVAAVDATIPPLDEVRTQVENEIVQQKRQLLISDYIGALRASSTVEILI